MSTRLKGFRFRGFISLLLFFSFLLSALSGLILFLRPEGSLANWLGWTVLGMDKKHWEEMHAVHVLVFFLTVLVHLIYNWKVLFANLRRKKTWLVGMFKGVGLTREFVCASVLIALIFAGTLLGWPPFSAVAKLRRDIKDGRYLDAIRPPAVDAERLTIAALCLVSGISERQALSNAAASGVRIGSLSETLAAVAKKNRLAPEKVFVLLKGD